MRSRFSAFAVGLGAYLVDTLARSHADREVPASVLARELGRVKDGQRFMGLRILHASSEGDRGAVTFFARIFERGVDCSFAERSRFVREDGRWKYADGDLVSHDRLPTDPNAITRETIAEILLAGS